MQRDLTFDSARHEYKLGGIVVPGVTKVIDCVQDWSRIPPDVLRLAADRGTAVHIACHLDDLGILDETSVDPQVEGFLDAWRAYRAEHRPTWDRMESPMAHTALRCAGTPDREGLVGGRYGIRDIKTTSTMHPGTGLQLTGYRMLAEHVNPTRKVDVLEAIQLKKNGTYKIHAYPFEPQVFVSCLNLYYWKANHGLN